MNQAYRYAVVDRTCRQLRSWRDQGLTVPRLAVNLSAAQFQTNPIKHPLAAQVQAQVPRLVQGQLRGAQVDAA